MAKKAEEAIQPQVNIGLVGHVDTGKTTLTQQLSGKWTDTHSEELKRGITIRLGYANASIYKCKKCKKYSPKEECKCGGKAEFVRKISLVDAPGHESLMATMLSGTTIMDGAILMIGANESCPQPQTREHLMALAIIGVKKVVVVQNKIDGLTPEKAEKNYKEIKAFLKGTKFENAPIIPMAARYGVNIDLLLDALETYIPTPERNPKLAPRMLVARSFDINKPGSGPKKWVGGVLGGALTQGSLKVGDTIEICPGYEVEREGRKFFKPLKTTVLGLKTAEQDIEQAIPGGSIALLTKLDPSIVKSDALSGSIVGKEGDLPKVWYELKLETHLLKRVVGTKEATEVEGIKMGEPLLLNVNAAATVGIVTDLHKDYFTCKLKLPVCADAEQRVTISRRIGTRFRLVGYGVIKE